MAKCHNLLILLVRPAGFEPAAYGFEERMRNTFRDIAESILPFARQKYLDVPALQQRRQRILDRWGEIRRAVAPAVIPAEISTAHLKAAGAVCRAVDLGISTEELRFAYNQARWIPNRYTVLDLTAEIGVSADWLDAVSGGV